MRLYYHLVYPHLSNTYLVVSEETKEGLLIDPGSLDLHLVETIEKNGYSIAGVLTTLHSPPHTDGLPTLMRVYPTVQVFSAEKMLYNCSCVSVQDGDVLELAGFKVDSLECLRSLEKQYGTKLVLLFLPAQFLPQGARAYDQFIRSGPFNRADSSVLYAMGAGNPSLSWLWPSYQGGLELQFNADLNTSSLKPLNSVHLP
jgi:hypothetical protein